MKMKYSKLLEVLGLASIMAGLYVFLAYLMLIKNIVIPYMP